MLPEKDDQFFKFLVVEHGLVLTCQACGASFLSTPCKTQCPKS
jgi:rubrerythrin